MSVYVFGHKNPDADSICAAIALSYLKGVQGEETVPSRLGECNSETRFILEHFGFEQPLFKNSYEGCEVMLVDNTDKSLCAVDIDKAHVKVIVDHHKLGDITTDVPLECWIRPVGSSCTVVYEMFMAYGIEIPKNIAGLLLSAILVDTVILSSPTTTQTDSICAEKLAEIAGIEDIKAFGMEIYKVKSSVAGINTPTLLKQDRKIYVMNGNAIGISILESVDLSSLEERKQEFLEHMAFIKKEKELHSMIVLLTDIIKKGSEVLLLSDDEKRVTDALGLDHYEHFIWCDGVISRKKQVVPPLERVFAD